MDWMTNWIFDLLYNIQKSICYIIDFIRDIFYMLAGIEPITIGGKKTDILSHFIQSRAVKNAFLYILLIAIVLLVIFVLIAVIRSEYSSGEQNKKSKTQILGKAFQSFLIFLLVPFILISGILLTNTVVKSINTAMNPSYNENSYTTTIGGQILVTSGNEAYIGDDSIRNEIEQKFVSGELDYAKASVVKTYYKIRDIDFFVGIIGSLVILVMFVMSAIMFIQRIFDIVLLFIISPVSISTIPVDDGNRFRLWREMTISKVLGAYGIILSMNLFFIIIPQLSSIMFFSNSFQNGIVQILFLIGGAFAVTKANLVIAQLTGSSAGNQETQQMIANIRTARGVGMGMLGVGGTILGGAQFKSAQKTHGLKGGITSTFKASVSRQYDTPKEDSQIARYAKMPTRLATMPLGMMKDLASGGVVGMTRNFTPRVRNIATGDSLFSHAQKRRTQPKTPEENKGETK